MSHVRFYRRTKPYDSAGGLGKISQHRRRRTLPLKRDQVSGEKPPDGTAGQGIFNEVTLNTRVTPQNRMTEAVVRVFSSGDRQRLRAVRVKTPGGRRWSG